MKKVLILSLALILLLGMAARGTFGLFSDTETATGNTFTAWVEEGCAKFCVCDHEDNRVYKYDASGALVDDFDLSDGPVRPQGISVVGTDIYVLDSGGDYVYHYTCSGDFEGVSKRLLPTQPSGTVTNGLAIDGDDLWLVSSPPHKIYRYSLSAAFPGGGNLNADQEINLNISNPGATGLAIDTSYLYVVNINDLKVYVYPRSGGSAVASKVLKGVGGSSLDEPRGATVDGDFIWVVDCGTDKVYQYDKDALFTGSGTINAIDEFSLDSANGDASGI
jgi:predicted ribosomally synthesized peptide with SipW-like signal peptide